MNKEPADRGTMKTSTILIAAGRKTAIYRRIEEVPPRLRSKLEKSTAGPSAGTVLIADRRGAQELLKANIRALLDRKTAQLPKGFAGSIREEIKETWRLAVVYRRPIQIVLLALLFLCCLVLAIRL